MNTFRMIPFQYFNAYMNMALDEAIMETVRAGTSLPTIRFYGWNPSAVSIGYFQGILNEVNLDATGEAGVDVIRRQTGGGAVYHDCLGEITYSLIAPIEMFPINIIKSYQVICEDIIYALKKIGIEANFEPVNDIISGGQKISGNAQTRKGGILLQHGTILYNVDVDKMFTLLNVSDKKTVDKLIKSVKKRVTSVSDKVDASMQDLLIALEEGFSRNRIIRVEDYLDSELSRAGELTKEKYQTEAWNHRL